MKRALLGLGPNRASHGLQKMIFNWFCGRRCCYCLRRYCQWKFKSSIHPSVRPSIHRASLTTVGEKKTKLINRFVSPPANRWYFVFLIRKRSRWSRSRSGKVSYSYFLDIRYSIIRDHTRASTCNYRVCCLSFGDLFIESLALTQKKEKITPFDCDCVRVWRVKKGKFVIITGIQRITKKFSLDSTCVFVCCIVLKYFLRRCISYRISICAYLRNLYNLNAQSLVIRIKKKHKKKQKKLRDTEKKGV